MDGLAKPVLTNLSFSFICFILFFAESFMIILEHLFQLEDATRRAIEKKPALRIIAFGHYEVQGTSKVWYTVTCKRNESGQRIIHCTCDKGYRHKNVACYHMVPAIGAHILLKIAQDSLGAERIRY